MKLVLIGSQRLLRKSSLVVLFVIAAKFAVHELDWEIVTLNPLITGLIAANVFLMGFLLSGVLADYKESERLPGELAASMETITDEALTSWTARKDAVSRDCLAELSGLASTVVDWFYKRTPTERMIERIAGLNRHLHAYESILPANFVVRLRQEQNNLRRMVIRIHTIRETSFIPSGYVISEVVTLALLAGLILAKIVPFHDSLFCIALITFLFAFMGFLIRDLDNPFGYYESGSDEDVSIKPVLDTAARLEAIRTSLPQAG